MDISASSNTTACVPDTFSNLTPIFGVDYVNASAAIVSNYTLEVPAGSRFTAPAIVADKLSFCNVTITYTHPNTSDSIHVETWLPLSDEWNERLYAAGGGGMGAGRFGDAYNAMSGFLAEGYAVVTTDAGFGTDLAGLTGDSWVLRSPGNINWDALEHWGSSSLKEQAVIGKSVVKEFFGKSAKYSYFNGCSSGGRQGLALAQRYPDEYNGIIAGAPGLDLPKIISALYWPQQIMHELKAYPAECEINALVQASIDACDELDGAKDGIIGDPRACTTDKFDPFAEIDKEIDCPALGNKTKISKAAAQVLNETWHGMSTSYGESLYYAPLRGANLTGHQGSQGGACGTNCSGLGACTGMPSIIGDAWMRLFGAKDAKFDATNMTREEFQHYVMQSETEVSSFFNTDNPDLTEYRNGGSKLITWHGLADDVVPPDGTQNYYRAVQDRFQDVNTFYKHFEIPGMDHCQAGAKGGQPTALFQQLRAWVENGTVPDSSPVTLHGKDGEEWKRDVCPSPAKATLQDGCADPKEASCWKCV